MVSAIVRSRFPGTWPETEDGMDRIMTYRALTARAALASVGAALLATLLTGPAVSAAVVIDMPPPPKVTAPAPSEGTAEATSKPADQTYPYAEPNGTAAGEPAVSPGRIALYRYITVRTGTRDTYWSTGTYGPGYRVYYDPYYWRYGRRSYLFGWPYGFYGGPFFSGVRFNIHHSGRRVHFNRTVK